ncbi:MAG TPA: bacterial transcriptional activator domain-containing protein [Acidimicrobiales bacterium]|nr:bacterial transcriptional activator domain-containing protein [Acidimicrobiales bacterium]
MDGLGEEGVAAGHALVQQLIAALGAGGRRTPCAFLLEEGRPRPVAARLLRLPEGSLGDAPPPAERPEGHLLCLLGELFVDLTAARVTRLVGSAGAVAELAARLAAAAGSAGEGCSTARLASAAGELPVLTLAALAALPRQRPPLLVVALAVAPEELEMALRLIGSRSDVVVLTNAPHPRTGALLVAEPDGGVGLFLPARAAEEEPLEDAPPPAAAARCGPQVRVAVLGSVVIEGLDGELRRHPKLTELITYLAVHPAGSQSRLWTAALWPERRVPQQTVANRLSEARRLLGCGPDGLPRLGRDGERHRLRDVTTDWAEFSRLAAPQAGATSWHAALELVRGRPFEDLQEGQWTLLEGFVSEMEEQIAAVALRLGGHALDLGEADEALWAARQALRAAPFDERLHRLLMRAADRAGNRVAIDGVLRQLALVLEIDGDPLAAVHPETAALYAELSGNRRLVGR